MNKRKQQEIKSYLIVACCLFTMGWYFYYTADFWGGSTCLLTRWSAGLKLAVIGARAEAMTNPNSYIIMVK